jgi:hypothetical protein
MPYPNSGPLDETKQWEERRVHTFEDFFEEIRALMPSEPSFREEYWFRVISDN